MNIFRIVVLLLLSSSCFGQDTLLTLDQAIQLALKNNYGVIIARNETEIGKINNNWATAGAIPVISATATKVIGTNNITQVLSNGTETKKSGASSQNLNAGLNISWRVFDGYRMFATKRRLEELERAGELSFTNTVNETVYNVVTGYYDIVRLNEQLRANQEQLALFGERVHIADVKFRIGSSAKNDLLQAQVDLNEQVSAGMSIKNSIQLAKENLKNIMGQRPDTNYRVADTIILSPLPAMSDVQSKIEQQNPQLLLARNQVAVLVQTRREINAERLPSVTLNGNYNFVRSSSAAGFNLLNQTYGPSASVTVAVPLFNGGVIKRQARVADIQIKNQEITVQELRNTLQTTLANAVTNYQNALTLVNIEKDNLKYSQENLFIASERFRLLNITAVELRQVQISYADAQTRLVNALYQAKIAEADIALLTGEISKL